MKWIVCAFPGQHTLSCLRRRRIRTDVVHSKLDFPFPLFSWSDPPAPTPPPPACRHPVLDRLQLWHCGVPQPRRPRGVRRCCDDSSAPGGGSRSAPQRVGRAAATPGCRGRPPLRAPQLVTVAASSCEHGHVNHAVAHPLFSPKHQTFMTESVPVWLRGGEASVCQPLHTVGIHPTADLVTKGRKGQYSTPLFVRQLCQSGRHTPQKEKTSTTAHPP